MSKAPARQRNLWMAGALFTLVACAAFTFAPEAPSQAVAKALPAAETPVEPTPQHHAAQSHAKMLSSAFRASAEAVLPTVVTIETRSTPKVARQAPRGEQGQRGLPRENPFKGTPFEHFFDENSPHGQQFGMEEGQPRAPRGQGTGSGVIVDKSGIVLTNNHVVEGADEVLVRLHDGREFKATNIKTDPQTDLAVLRLEGAGSLPAATLGDSDALDIGDWVIAVGNPFGLDSTVSAGIISGKQRVLGSGQRTRFLQTDAAINPGNSGGPLVNLDGEVIGINTAIATNSGGYQGVGFAIPGNQAKWVMRQLIDSGSVQRAWLGVGIGLMTPELANQFGVPAGQGVLVSEVVPNSPAATAGMREGDVITQYAGTQVRNPRDLQEVVERSPLDTKQTVMVLRDGKPLAVQVAVSALPKDPAQLAKKGADGGKADVRPMGALGMTVSDMSAEEARHLGFEGQRGVLITDVEADGPAATAGLSAGMLVLKIGKQEVHNVAEFDAAIEKQSLEQGVLMLVRTEAGNRFVVMRVAK